MLARHKVPPRLQSLIDLYCYLPPRTRSEIHEAVNSIRQSFDSSSVVATPHKLKTLIFQEICLPVAASNRWISAARLFRSSEAILGDATMQLTETINLIDDVRSESVFRFLRHISRNSLDGCRLIEGILERAQQRGESPNENLMSTLVDNLADLPMKHLSGPLLQLLYAHAVRSGKIDEIRWLFRHKWSTMPSVLEIPHSTSALDIIRLAVRTKVQLRTSEVTQQMHQLLGKFSKNDSLLLQTAKEYDRMENITANSVYHETGLIHAVRNKRWQHASRIFHSAVAHGTQLTPQAVCALATGMMYDGRWQNATRVLSAYADSLPNIPMRSFGHMVRLFIRLGRHSIAYGLLEHHSPLITTDYALASLLHFLSRDGEWEMLLSLYEKLQPKPAVDLTRHAPRSPELTWAQRSSLASTSIGYETILDGFIPRQWRAAMATYGLMLDRSVLINYKILTKLLVLCCKANRWEPAMAVYTNVHRVHRSHRGIDLYAGYMGNLHQCLASHGKWDLNAALFNSSVVCPTEICANVCVASAVASDKWSVALALMSRMAQMSQRLSCVSLSVLREAEGRLAHGQNVYAKVVERLARGAMKSDNVLENAPGVNG